MKWFVWISIAVVLLLVGSTVAVWVLQNADQTAQLRFDLGSGLGLAWAMEQPVSVPQLMLGSFGLGAVLVGLPMWFAGWRWKRKASSLAFTADSFSDADPYP